VPVTFDYEPWDPAKEVMPKRGESFNEGFLQLALFSGITPLVGDPLRIEIIKTLQANLWTALARFRQLGVSNRDLQRMVKTYPNRGLSEDAQARRKASRAHGFSNVSNEPIDMPADSRRDARESEGVWTLHSA